MRLKFFTIPIHDDGEAADELNGFLASHSVISVDRQLLSEGLDGAWAIAVTYDPGDDRRPASKNSRVDYKELLSPDDFRVYARLRELRKRLAESNALPPYTVFKNEQLAEMVRGRVRTLEAMSRISGVGKARLEKYGAAFLNVLNDEDSEERRTNDDGDGSNGAS